MCGISGELRWDGASPDLRAIQRMMDQLARRGPDYAAHYSDGPLAFGHRRLSIIDLSARSHQPMVDDELGLVLVFNGTIYNYRELRAELIARGYHFFSDGDSEVILKAYAAFGSSCVEHLHGMFAFAIWNKHAKELFLARDRLGIKPLYYTLQKTFLRFASSTQALLAAGDIDTSIDAVALHHHLTLHAVVPAPRTLLAGIRKLPPATTMTIDAQGRRTERCYWQLSAQRPATARSDWEYIDEVGDELRAAVQRRRLAADVPVGVLLSGGLDSSLLVALLAEDSGENLRTFSVGFEHAPEEQGDEFHYSDQVAARYATRHHKFLVPNAEILQRLPEAIANMAEPMVGQDAIAFYLLSERVAQEVKVVQSGQGADEVFGGYFWYPLMAAEREGAFLERFRRYYFDRSHAEYLRTVTADYHGPDYTSAGIDTLLAAPGADSFMDRVLRLDVTTLITDDPVKRVDNMTMAFGLEARVPFLDHKLVELAASLPPDLKLRNGGKYPLKALARGLIPDAIIDRPKGYFPVPALKYVRGPFLDFMRHVLHSESCRRRNLFNRHYVEKLLADPEWNLTPLQGSKLWHCAALEYWLQLNVDRLPT